MWGHTQPHLLQRVTTPESVCFVISRLSYPDLSHVKVYLCPNFLTSVPLPIPKRSAIATQPKNPARSAAQKPSDTHMPINRIRTNRYAIQSTASQIERNALQIMATTTNTIAHPLNPIMTLI